MEDEKQDYHYYVAQARKYREMADNDDGYRRRMLLGIAGEMEMKARRLLRQQPGTGTE